MRSRFVEGENPKPQSPKPRNPKKTKKITTKTKYI